VFLLEFLQSGMLDIVWAVSSKNSRGCLTFSSRKWATPSTNSQKAANQLRCVSVLSMASRSSFSLSSIWASSSAAEVIAKILFEWEVVRLERVWLNLAIAGSRVGTGIATGTIPVSGGMEFDTLRPRTR